MEFKSNGEFRQVNMQLQQKMRNASKRKCMNYTSNLGEWGGKMASLEGV